jgi:hypothetical protein
MTIWHILYSFVTFFPLLLLCTKKNLAALIESGFVGMEEIMTRERKKETDKKLVLSGFSLSNSNFEGQSRQVLFCFSQQGAVAHQTQKDRGFEALLFAKLKAYTFKLGLADGIFSNQKPKFG